jgi:putative transposase
MPRIARVIATEYPHHITQRGNNRAIVFFDDEDRQTYLKLLAGYSEKHHFQIWAYCLMNNHIHLLAVPETESSLARGIGLTNQVYTQYINRKLGQSGRIWQNRFFSCVVENNQYLWAVARYIERNPLKIASVEKAESYQWSSANAHITGANDPLLSANTWLPLQEQSAYAEFVRSEDEEIDNAIRRATRTGRPFGSESFVDLLEFQLKQPLKAKRRGRPCKTIGECP